jgi:hypothetical protein
MSDRLANIEHPRATQRQRDAVARKLNLAGVHIGSDWYRTIAQAVIDAGPPPAEGAVEDARELARLGGLREEKMTDADWQRWVELSLKYAEPPVGGRSDGA